MSCSFQHDIQHKMKKEKDFITEYKKKYAPLWEAMKPVSAKRHKELVEVCQKNMWLRVNGIPFQDDPALEEDSPYTFSDIPTVDALVLFFGHGNWSIRQGVVYKDLFFCNQVNGGDEWWTCRYDKAQGKWVPFESVTFAPMVRSGEFRSYIARLRRATIDQCVSLKY